MRFPPSRKCSIMKKIIQTTAAPSPIGPYNQAVLSGNTLYTSGQIAIVPETGALLKGTIQEETKLVMQHLEAVLEAASMTFEHCLLYTSPSPRDRTRSRMPSSA